ncbi:MAG: arginine decarboxylase [Pseudozobellia sp.]|nr:arginine decarboxylase [Pseudozobellia sp.]MBG50347.1 arginine decarboxylase [Pseudozobellia sp.]MBG50523.1 arginine decarboxylase [Pseudozobellia sp.]|tara:strand:+ start:654 stop:866 length:213 start_codon:yes stop_codon:yes gene_type:complete
MTKQTILLGCLIIAMSSCTAVKEYQKVNINDPNMQLSEKKVDRNLTIMHSYREGSVGANGGKTGGGCGCN